MSIWNFASGILNQLSADEYPESGIRNSESGVKVPGKGESEKLEP
jgi:hypothetical protein